MRRSSRSRSSEGATGSCLSSQGSEILCSEKYRDSPHASSRSHMTAPTSLAGDASDGKTRATLDLRLISLSVRS